MSEIGIYQALELELANVGETLPTIFDNTNKATPPGAHQIVSVFLARPENPTMGDGFYRQRGYMQVSVRYPANEGAGETRERAFALRDHFSRGFTMTAEGVTTTVEETPEIGSGSNDGEHYVINVFVRFWADIFGA